LEAHATNEWPINNLPDGVNALNQATTLQERIDAAKLFKNIYSANIHPKTSLVVDGADNAFNDAYPSWPFRVWILHEGMVALKAMSTTDGSNLEVADVERWLVQFRLCKLEREKCLLQQQLVATTGPAPTEEGKRTDVGDVVIICDEDGDEATVETAANLLVQVGMGDIS
jgi:hypothetical protein